jgi:ankyrin repeat protein
MGTALQYAARRTGQETFQILLSAGADVNLQGDGYGTALQVAASRGFYARVKMLLDAGADVNLQGGFYGSALQAARGNQQIVKLLLSAGARDRNNTSE